MSWDELDDTELLEQLEWAYFKISSVPAPSPEALAELEQLEWEVLHRSDSVRHLAALLKPSRN